MDDQLPPAPWTYRPGEHDDWGFVRDANGHLVANTCPSGVGESFRNECHEWGPVHWAGPPQARAVAELLIDARAERDPTPLTFDHLRAMGWEIHRVTADHPKLPIQAMTGFTKTDLLIGGVVVAKAATLGDLRTLTRILTR